MTASLPASDRNQGEDGDQRRRARRTGSSPDACGADPGDGARPARDPGRAGGDLGRLRCDGVARGARVVVDPRRRRRASPVARFDPEGVAPPRRRRRARRVGHRRGPSSRHDGADGRSRGRRPLASSPSSAWASTPSSSDVRRRRRSPGSSRASAPARLRPGCRGPAIPQPMGCESTSWRRSATSTADACTLSPTEYAVLTFLMSHPQQALPVHTIVRRVWGWLPSDWQEHAAHLREPLAAQARRRPS